MSTPARALCKIAYSLSGLMDCFCPDDRFADGFRANNVSDLTVFRFECRGGTACAPRKTRNIVSNPTVMILIHLTTQKLAAKRDPLLHFSKVSCNIYLEVISTIRVHEL